MQRYVCFFFFCKFRVLNNLSFFETVEQAEREGQGKRDSDHQIHQPGERRPHTGCATFGGTGHSAQPQDPTAVSGYLTVLPISSLKHISNCYVLSIFLSTFEFGMDVAV